MAVLPYGTLMCYKVVGEHADVVLGALELVLKYWVLVSA
jgi:hypothetical protein